MKNVRNSLAALMVSLTLAFAGHETKVSCHLQRHRRTHAPRHFKLSDPIKQALLDAKYDRDAYHPTELSNSQMNCDANSPIVSFGLNENGESGGFGDRLLGMVTTYYLAMMTNSSFEVHWTRPYNLSDYFLVPSCPVSARPKRNDVADDGLHRDTNHGALEMHRSDDEIVRSVIASNEFDVWTYFTDALFLNDIGKNLEIITNSFHWKQIVRNQAFKDRAASLGLSEMSQAELFKLAIDELLGNPTTLVRDSYVSVLRRLAAGYEPNEFGPSYVGVQIRLGGGAVSGWQDPSRHSMDDVQCFAKEAVRLCSRFHMRSIFVTADSEAAVRAFEEGVARESVNASTDTSSSSPPPIVVQVPGVIAHTDRSNVAEEHAKDIWLKSILDWWVLKHATALVVSRSGFGETAAMSSDAEAALRLMISPATKSSGSAEGSRSKCEFEDLLRRDKDVLRYPWS